MLPSRSAARRSPAAALAFAWGGAALFACALLYFLYSYLIRFGVVSGDANVPAAVTVDILLFSTFALHHSVLARTTMKARIERLVPPALERSLYTWTASVLFLLVCAWWRPIPGELYHLTGAAAAIAYAIQAGAALLTVRASTRLDVLDLAGVRQVLPDRRAASTRHVPLETRGLYGFVRHPVYFGWVLLVFSAPHMTMTRLVFAAVSTGYLAIAVPFEERGLVQTFGADYTAYRKLVRWRMIPGVY